MPQSKTQDLAATTRHILHRLDAYAGALPVSELAWVNSIIQNAEQEDSLTGEEESMLESLTSGECL